MGHRLDAFQACPFLFGEVELPLPDYQSGCQSQLVFFVSWTGSFP
jgi:hypothetical protein